MSPDRDMVTEGSSGGADLTNHRRIRGRGWRTRLRAFLVSTLLCLVAAEVTARVFWRFSFGVPFRNPGGILYAFYPELKRVDRERPARDDEFYDVLLLGGSVLHKDYAPVAQDLREQLTIRGYRNVRVYNLAVPAHTSRDSWLKYAALGEARFELVVFYHGINDAKANTVPPELFREDYMHYTWYEIVNTLASYHGRTSFALPYTFHRLALGMRHAVRKGRYLPPHRPRADWVQYGKDIRSAGAFRRNLSAILDLANQRGDRVLLMTFATYTPDDYSLEGFMEKRLDYVLHDAPLEVWGAREHVLAAVAAHNEVVRSLAAQHEGVLFVDQATLMPGVRRYFNDACHFTVAGSSKFVEHLVSGLRF